MSSKGSEHNATAAAVAVSKDSACPPKTALQKRTLLEKCTQFYVQPFEKDTDDVSNECFVPTTSLYVATEHRRCEQSFAQTSTELKTKHAARCTVCDIVTYEPGAVLANPYALRANVLVCTQCLHLFQTLNK